jgi:hypothetical protein
MPISNYPNGFRQGVNVLGMPVLNTYAGQVLWVDSGIDSNGNNGTRDQPFATVDYAFSKCNANSGDKILVYPGHSETFAAADGAGLDVAGVTLEGLGRGTDRPKFIFDTADTADINISAANVTVRNFVFESGIADLVRCIQVTAAYAWIDYCEFTDQAATENFFTPIKATGTTDNEADGLTVTNCRWASVDAAGLEFIEGNADIKGLTVQNNMVVHEGTASPLVLMATGKDMQYCDIRGNFLSHKMTANELLINCDTSANSGIIAHNRVGHADVTTTHDLGIDGLGCRLFDNLSVSTDSLSGVVLPAIDVNS